MASKVPIIVSDFPRIRDIVSEDEVTFFETDNPDDLTDKINYVFKNNKKSKEKTLKAYKKVKNYTWGKRAENILQLFSQ